jgi:hypothetical protein
MPIAGQNLALCLEPVLAFVSTYETALFANLISATPNFIFKVDGKHILLWLESEGRSGSGA